MSAASTHSIENRKQCAPPDLERHTTKGSLSLRIFSTSNLWSRGYWSTSTQPHLHLFSALIGMIPIEAPLPERCSRHSFAERGSRMICALPVFFPLACFLSTRYVPYASCRPSKMAENCWTDIDTSEKVGGLRRPLH